MTAIVTNIAIEPEPEVLTDATLAKFAAKAVPPDALVNMLSQLDPDDLYDVILGLMGYWDQTWGSIIVGAHPTDKPEDPPASSLRHEVYTTKCPVSYCQGTFATNCTGRDGKIITWPHIRRYQLVRPGISSVQMRASRRNGTRGQYLPPGRQAAE